MGGGRRAWIWGGFQKKPSLKNSQACMIHRALGSPATMACAPPTASCASIEPAPPRPAPCPAW